MQVAVAHVAFLPIPRLHIQSCLEPAFPPPGLRLRLCLPCHPPACLFTAAQEEAAERLAAETAGRYVCPGWAAYAVPTM